MQVWIGDTRVTTVDVIRCAQQHDAAAWETIVVEHQEAAFRLAYLLLGNTSEAEDVAQEAFIRAFQALHRFDTERPLRPWLLRIVVNLAHNRQRSLRRYLAAMLRLSQQRPEGMEMLGDRTIHQEQAQLLWQAIRRLKPAEQEILYLRYFLELSEADMATALAVAPGTVKSRLHRSMQRLRTVIAHDYPQLREERQL